METNAVFSLTPLQFSATLCFFTQGKLKGFKKENKSENFPSSGQKMTKNDITLITYLQEYFKQRGHLYFASSPPQLSHLKQGREFSFYGFRSLPLIKDRNAFAQKTGSLHSKVCSSKF